MQQRQHYTITTVQEGMWVLTEISPSIFNVLSDLTGLFVSGVLFFVLGVAYPYLVWESVKRGYGVDLNGVIAPPSSLWEAFLRLRTGGYRWIMAGVAMVMLVATLSHTASDFFLDFVSVEVGSNQTYFLGSEIGDVPVRTCEG